MRSTIIYITVLVTCFASAWTITNPAWCTPASSVQTAVSFSHCSTALPNTSASWCDKSNVYNSVPLSFLDPDVNNKCTNPAAHCIGTPTSQLNDMTCEPDPLQDLFFVPPKNVTSNSTEILTKYQT